jgi:hypothetical protein
MLAIAARGQGLLIDQANTPVPPSFGFRYWALSYPGAAPIGQEFVPSFESLDFVDLMLYGGGGISTGTFAVSVHADNITAPILATSLPATRDDGLERVTHFEFGATVPLTAGKLYVIELSQLAVDSREWAVADTGGGYDSGRMLWGGSPPIQGGDLWFREGTVVPEPTVVALFAAGIAIVCLFRKRPMPNEVVQRVASGGRLS